MALVFAPLPGYILLRGMEMRKRRYKRKPYKPVDYDTIRETRLLLARMSKQDVAVLLNVSLRSVHYWEGGHVPMPWAAFRLLRILTGYELPGKAWEGWMLLRNQLISPDGKVFTPSDLYPLAWTVDKARTWDQDYKRRQAKKEAVVQLPLNMGDAGPFGTNDEADDVGTPSAVGLKRDLSGHLPFGCLPVYLREQLRLLLTVLKLFRD